MGEIIFPCPVDRQSDHMACSGQCRVSRSDACHYQAEDSMCFVISSDPMPGSVPDTLPYSWALEWRQGGTEGEKLA